MEQPLETKEARRAWWLDAFVMHLSKLGARAQPDLLLMMGEEIYDERWQLDPVEVAQAEWDMSPPHDD